jgi:6-phosphogluconate dehydrogenase
MMTKRSDIGLVGLGVMGRNFALNMAEHGFSVVGYDRDPSKIEALESEAGDMPVRAARDTGQFEEMLRSPKAVMMLVPAGEPVDNVIHDILPTLTAGDMVIDGGNSHFTDTNVRGVKLAERGVHFFGVGISGGESGARYGPSIMPGGPHEAYERIRPIFEAVAAHVDDEPCVAYLGPGSTGHYVKMVHNGIEYGFMQLIAETYHLLAKGLNCSDDELSEIYASWNDSELSSFLLEITARIFREVDDRTGRRLIDVILDEARQKGTGLWTSESALELQVPVPNINAGVEARDLSAYKALRSEEAKRLHGPSGESAGDKSVAIEDLRQALCAAMVLTYAQGFALLARASSEYAYDLNLGQVASIWRGGCIIRSALLKDIMAAYEQKADLPHLLVDEKLADIVVRHQEGLRSAVGIASRIGIPMPGMMAALAYFDSLRHVWLPANLIQAQRDYFGSHTYERVDQKGTFHTKWSRKGGVSETVQTA